MCPFGFIKFPLRGNASPTPDFGGFVTSMFFHQQNQCHSKVPYILKHLCFMYPHFIFGQQKITANYFYATALLNFLNLFTTMATAINLYWWEQPHTIKEVEQRTTCWEWLANISGKFIPKRRMTLIFLQKFGPRRTEKLQESAKYC